MPLWRKSPPAAEAAGGEAVPGYRDLQRVGRGGSSVVYRARQEGLDRIVALKVLSVEFIDAPLRRRFLREVRLTSRLTGHPNVVTVLDSGTTAAGRPYIAMEYFERGSLRDRLAAQGPLPLVDVLRIGVKVAGALGAAHQEGILHRDVKPQNILVSRYGEPALADFGTARLAAAVDASASMELLTPFHAAPEILQGQAPTPACDVYSLGSTLYHLLAGRPPYGSADGGIAALLLRVLQEVPPPIERSDVPPAVTQMIEHAMAKTPADRYPDAWSFAYALQQLQAELGLPMTELTNAPSMPASQRPSASPQRRPVAPMVAAAQTSPAFPQPPRPIDIEIPPDAAVVTAAEPAKDPAQRGSVGARTTAGQGDAAEPGAVRAEAGPAPSAQPVRSRRRWPFAVGIAVLAVAAGLTPIALGGRSHPAGSPSPARAARTPANGSWSAVAPVPPSVDAAAMRPTHLKVTDGGATVVLSWTLPPGSEAYNLLVDVSPHDPGQGLLVVAPGATTATVTGLKPTLGYCFQVGPILAFGVGSQSGTTALSDYRCIRGAHVVGPTATVQQR